MTPETIATIKLTAPVVAPHALTITQAFYKNLLTAHPSLYAFFNRANQPGARSGEPGAQPKALAHAIIAFASNIDNLGVLASHVEGITVKHCGLGVQPEHYSVVHDVLLSTIVEVLGREIVTAEIETAWSSAILHLASILIATETKLYALAAERKGGWTGLKDFTVVEIVQVTDGVKSFNFTPTEGSVDAFDFTPGQFVSLKIDPENDGLTAPRHYTLTSEVNSPLQITVKRCDKGVVSRYLHDKVKEGDVVKVAPPFGNFNATPSEDAGKKAVLISCGIGVTPLINLSKHLNAKDKVALVVHVDSTPESHCFVEHFNDSASGYETLFKYKSIHGAIQPEDLVDEIFEKLGLSDPLNELASEVEYDFYVCGSPSFEGMMKKALKLKDKGGESVRVFSEGFKGHFENHVGSDDSV